MQGGRKKFLSHFIPLYIGCQAINHKTMIDSIKVSSREREREAAAARIHRSVATHSHAEEQISISNESHVANYVENAFLISSTPASHSCQLIDDADVFVFFARFRSPAAARRDPMTT